MTDSDPRLAAASEAIRQELLKTGACTADEMCVDGPCLCAESAAKAALEAADRAAWRPIEDMPQDGFAWIAYNDPPVMRLCWWDKECWRDYERDVPVSNFFPPTHGQPLPAPPSEDSEDSET